MVETVERAKTEDEKIKAMRAERVAKAKAKAKAKIEIIIAAAAAAAKIIKTKIETTNKTVIKKKQTDIIKKIKNGVFTILYNVVNI